MSEIRIGKQVPRIIRLATLSAVAKAPGFLIPIVIASFFGAGHQTDAYFLAYTGILLVGGSIGQPLEAVVVPFAAHALSLGSRAAQRFMITLSRQGFLLGTAATAIGAVILLTGLLLTQPVGLSRNEVLLFYSFLGPSAIAWCVAGLYSGSLASGWHLEIAAVAYAFRGFGALVGAIVGLLLGHLWPVAVGASLGECGRLLWLKSRWHALLHTIEEGRDGSPDKGLVRAAAGQMTAQGLISGAQLVERFVVAGVAVGAVSHIEYANRLVMVAAILFDGGLAPWLLARWATLRIRGPLRSDWSSVYQPIALASAAALGVGVVLVVMSPLIVGVLLRHGAFTSSDAEVVTHLLKYYAAGYVLNMTTLCIERLLVARAQNHTLALLAVVRASVRVGAVITLISSMGIVALPMGYFIGELIYLFGLLVASRREVVSPQVADGLS